jgi:homospermidine synthase
MEKTQFKGKIVFVGCGSIAQGTLPLVLRHIEIKPEKIFFLSDNENGKKIVEGYECNFVVKKIDKDNYEEILKEFIEKGDFLINLSVNVESLSLIKFCQDIGALYIDTCNECWEGGFIFL